MGFDVNKFKQLIETLKEDLGDGFVATGVWNRADGQALIDTGDNIAQQKEIILFYEVTRKLDKTLQESEYPGLGSYYLVKLADNRLAVVLSVGEYEQYLLVDLSKTTLGLLISVALPNLIQGISEATKQPSRFSNLTMRLPPRGL